MTKILVCGDSYCVTDSEYTGLHWSEKILNTSQTYEIINLSIQGASNALIASQLLIGLKLKPDFVIMSFTSDGRYEFDNNSDAVPYSIDSVGLFDYIKNRYQTTSPSKEKSIILDTIRAGVFSESMEKIKNYLQISSCLATLANKKIPFCFTLGGFEYKQDYTHFLNSHYLENVFKDYSDNELSTNLWYHGTYQIPKFHVKDETIHNLFANECISRIKAI